MTKAQLTRFFQTWSSWAGSLFLISCFCIHFSPALGSISLALGILFSIGTAIQKNWKSVPLWLWLIPGLVIAQLTLHIYVGGSWQSFLEQALLKSPLMFAPVIYLAAKEFRNSAVWTILFSLPLAWLALASVLNYFLNFNFYNQMVLESKPIPIYSQVYHIEFSLFLALSSLLLLNILFTLGFRLKPQWQQYGLIILFFCNTLALNILSARTGLLTFWVGFFVLIIWMKRHWLKPRYLAFLAVFLVALMFALPSVRNRVYNSVDDLKSVVFQKDLNNKSFGQRWVAWNMSFKASSHQIITGHGLDRADEALQKEYSRSRVHLDVKNRITPHNQYLSFALQSGWLVVSLFMLALVLGIYYGYRQRNIFLMALLFSFASAMFFESLLERQAGILVFSILVPWIAGLERKEKV